MNQINKPDNTQRLEGEIIPPELAIKAMRDSGYNNTDYALAELIDNSVQAKATGVEVICIEKYQQVKSKTSSRIKTIGVLDNGEGMSPETLRLALQFGNGTHLTDRKGIGRFGMGLPNSSISQCRHVGVWTWQNGPDNAMYTYLDIDEIEKRSMFLVPEPQHRPLPKEWRSLSNIVGTTGTLVQWSKLETHRLSWKRAKATLKNTEFLIGRMYRKFINDGRLSIRLLALIKGYDDSTREDRIVRVNDPLYLMGNSSTPKPFDIEPMFQRWGEHDEKFSIQYNGTLHEVFVRISYAHDKTLPDDNKDRGSKEYGKHAAKNIGLSIVREGRELNLDKSWTNNYDPVERWWGVEVEFPSALDEIFGVTNSKQDATIFSAMAQFNWKTEAERGELLSDFIDRIKGDGDPRALLLRIVVYIHTQLKEIRIRLKEQTAGRRTKSNRHNKPSAADTATVKYRERAKHGHSIDADKEEFTEKDCKSLERDLRDEMHYSDKVAKEIVNAILFRKRKVDFYAKAMDGYAFFNVEIKQGGLTAIVFNTKHPFYKPLMESLEPPNNGDESDADLVDRIHKASDTLHLLFAAWARYELEEANRKDYLFDMRQEWGKMARFILTEPGEE